MAFHQGVASQLWEVLRGFTGLMNPSLPFDVIQVWAFRCTNLLSEQKWPLSLIHKKHLTMNLVEWWLRTYWKWMSIASVWQLHPLINISSDLAPKQRKEKCCLITKHKNDHYYIMLHLQVQNVSAALSIVQVTILHANKQNGIM